MKPPPLPPKPPPEDKSASRPSLIMALLLLGGALVGLLFLSLGLILGPLILLLLVLPAIAFFHYLLWGWWLGKIIERSGRGDEE